MPVAAGHGAWALLRELGYSPAECRGLVGGAGCIRLRRRGRMRALVAVAAIGTAAPALFGCGAPPPREADVVRALVNEYAPPLRDAVFVGVTSDCRSARGTDAPVDAALFAAFLAANRGAARQDLGPHARRVRLDESGELPSLVAAREGRSVVALSRAGIVDDAALVCVEAFGADRHQLGHLVLLARVGAETWSLRAAYEVWRRDVARPEELPDGRLFDQ